MKITHFTEGVITTDEDLPAGPQLVQIHWSDNPWAWFAYYPEETPPYYGDAVHVGVQVYNGNTTANLKCAEMETCRSQIGTSQEIFGDWRVFWSRDGGRNRSNDWRSGRSGRGRSRRRRRGRRPGALAGAAAGAAAGAISGAIGGAFSAIGNMIA